MMRKRLDPKYLKVSLYVFFTAAAVILFWQLLQSSTDLWKSLAVGMRFLWTMLSPFFAALALAYILAPVASLLERLLCRIWKRSCHRRRIRIASIVTIYAMLAVLLAVAVSYIIPAAIRNAADLVGNMPRYAEQATRFYEELIQKEPFKYLDIQKYVDDAIVQGKQFISEWIPTLVPGLAHGLISIAGGVVNGILAIVLSMYLLLERGNISGTVRRVMQGALGEERTRQTMSLLTAADRVFGRYIGTRLLESFIVFVLAQIAFLIIGVRYSVLMSTIVAVTNLVPYVGPIIGGVLPVVVTLLEDPVRALVVVAVLSVIQVLDAYFISPRLMGDKLGMSPFWVLLVIILGGGFFGLWGILLSVPVAAVIRLAVSQAIRNRVLRRRKEQEQEQAQVPPHPPA